MKLHVRSAIICRNPPPRARLRLFCLPYAGGGASTYSAWEELLPPHTEVCAIELPGRESKSREAPFTAMAPLVDQLADLIQPLLNIPFAFFGHSMGALISFELARELRRRRLRAPSRLFISGCRAPHLPDNGEQLHRLSPAEFIKAIQRLNGSEACEESSALVEFMLPTLVADMTLCEQYVYSLEEPLDVSISALAGLSDPRVSENDALEWRRQTKAHFSLRMFAGDHFFLRTATSELLQAVVEDLAGSI
ncbi:MAG: alpha/beta fold hydrolase [Acidobacteria bacterium]|nr:alpha/beta fold hydrolase [Acidobacteriota bacterium]